MGSNIENQLIRILSDLNKVEGIDGSLIADNNGNIICQNMSRRADTSLFGSMANVITSSSKRLLNSINGGEIQRVLVESYGGKALFLHLENTHFVVLMELSANVGLVMVSAKRVAQEIVELTKDIVCVVPVEDEIIDTSLEKTPVTSEETVASGINEKTVEEEITATSLEELSITSEETTMSVASEKTENIAELENEASELSKSDEIIEAEELNVESVDKLIETEDLKEAAAKVIGTEKLDKILESEELKAFDVAEAKEELAEILKIEIEDKTGIGETTLQAIKSEDLEISKESSITADEANMPEIEVELKIEEVEAEEPESVLPVIKPPISFPKLPEDVKIPDGDKEKSDLILDIYEIIFLAMSIGAGKIMGVSPARGLIRNFLPLDECKSLLDGVDVKSNSVVDFGKIRENAENIPLNERETKLITDFSKIISIITENYGKVMGYSAFRGMVRTEFKVINTSYGNAMDELGIKDKIHPELTDLFK